MKKFFLSIEHFIEKLDHEAVMFIHFLDSVFSGTEIQAAIGFVQTATTTFLEKEIDAAGNRVEAFAAKAIANTQRREWVVGTLVQKLGLTEAKARVLTETMVGLAKKEVDGLLSHLANHYQTAAIEQESATSPAPPAPPAS